MIWHRNVNMLNLILSFMWYDFPKMIFLLFCFIPGQRTVYGSYQLNGDVIIY